MRSRKQMRITAIALFTLLAMPIGLAAQSSTLTPSFKFVDLGTLGGLQSSMQGGAQVLNNHGVVVGLADTSEADPNYPNFNPLLGQDMFIQHATAWVNGVAHDLGTLPGGYSSFAAWISDGGLIAGIAENGSIDPVTGWPATDAVGWKNGRIRKFGTLGGNQAGANSINDLGQAAGFAANTIPDQYSFFGWGTQTRAFRWTPTEGMQDLNTLGGPDAAAWLINQKGQIAGQSYINSNPNSIITMCGNKVPTVDAFLWEKGKGMTDLPSLGGTCSAANGLNNSGQVAGLSYISALSYDPVLWSKGNEGYEVKDLGTFGGHTGQATWLNDAGEVVGFASDKSGSNRAFLWINGELKNLGALTGDTCSAAFGINSKTQIIGNSLACGGDGPVRPFLWQRGSIYDLSTAFPPGYFESAEANFINDRGEIAGNGVLPNDELHAYVLIPCKAGTEGCIPVTDGATALPQSGELAHDLSIQIQHLPGVRRGYGYNIPPAEVTSQARLTKGRE